MGAVAAAAAGGDRRALLVAMRDVIAGAIDDPDCPKRELAALTRRLSDIDKEIQGIDASDQEASNAEVEDGEFDPETV